MATSSNRRRQYKPYGKRTDGYRSGLEARVAADLKSRGVEHGYETVSFEYVTVQTYTPDFVLEKGTDRRIVIEVKGWFKPEDRTKLLAVKKQNPKADIRLLFQRAKSPLYKGSKTTYAQWAEEHGFPWAEGTVPQSWVDEP